MTPRRLYERQDGETGPAWAAFQAYRDAGPSRSVAKVAGKLGKSSTLLSRWSSRHDWVARAAAYDVDADREWRAQQAAARRDMAHRHAHVAAKMLTLVVRRLGQLDPAKLSPAELARWLEVAARVEREALGAPDRVEVSGLDGGPVQVLDLTDEDRRARLRQLQAEIAKRLEAGRPEDAGLPTGGADPETEKPRWA